MLCLSNFSYSYVCVVVSYLWFVYLRNLWLLFFSRSLIVSDFALRAVVDVKGFFVCFSYAHTIIPTTFAVKTIFSPLNCLCTLVEKPVDPMCNTICIFLLISEHCFICLLAIYIFSLRTHLFKIFVRFVIRLF